MRIFCTFFLIALFCFVRSALTQEIVLGLSKNEIGITAFFDGSEILVFGAIKATDELISNEPLGVAVTIASPLLPVMVRRKEKRFGIWVNVDAVEIDLAPNFYAVATTAAFSQVVDPVSDLRHSISMERMIRSVGAPMTVDDPDAFAEALIRIRQDQGLYKALPGAVTLQDNTLFSTSVTLPANLVEGAYTARIFLTQDGNVIAQKETTIDVRKVGIERWLYNLAHQHPATYGLLSLAIAIFAGWSAAAVFRVIRA
jgi:uncharacterized protein (TIGR02186 family)